MNKKIALLPASILLTVLMQSTAHAQYDCELEMEEAFGCAADALSTEKKNLNKAYMSIYQTLDASQKKNMDNDQIAWLKKRDIKCTGDYTGARGNMAVWIGIGDTLCVAEQNANRTNYYLNTFNK